MGVSVHEVWLALNYPESVVDSSKYAGCQNFRRNRICVGANVDGDEIKVITVVWPSHELWRKHIEKTGGAGGRKVKPWLNL